MYNKKKMLSLISISLATASIFVGCGGGDSSAVAISNTTGSSVVTPVKGPVYGAIVKDANGQIAQQIEGKPEYQFTNTPVYPVTVSGGWADQNYDGVMNLAPNGPDIVMTESMKSFTSVVTPITTQASQNANNSEEFEANLAKIAAELSSVSDKNLTADDLLKVGTDADPEVALLNLVVYPDMQMPDINYITLYDEKIKDYDLPDNLNATTLIDLEEDIFNINDNLTLPTYSEIDNEFISQLSSAPVYNNETGDMIDIYNNIDSYTWSNIKANYEGYSMYKNDVAMHCNTTAFEAIDTVCYEESFENRDENVHANIIYIYTQIDNDNNADNENATVDNNNATTEDDGTVADNDNATI